MDTSKPGASDPFQSPIIGETNPAGLPSLGVRQLTLARSVESGYGGLMEFEWDAGKAARNLAKHGVSFHKAATVFGDPLAMTYPDPDDSEGEDRFLTFGHPAEGDLLTVSHTDRGDRTRIISARRATQKEKTLYDKG